MTSTFRISLVAFALGILPSPPAFAQEPIDLAHGLEFECPCSVEADGEYITATFGVSNTGDNSSGVLSVRVGIFNDWARTLSFEKLVIADSLGARATLPSTSYRIAKFDESFKQDLRWFYAGRLPTEAVVHVALSLEDSRQEYRRYLTDNRCWPAECPDYLEFGHYPVDLSERFEIRSLDYLLDIDEDGIGDLNEQIAQTDPNDPKSTPKEAIIDVVAFYTRSWGSPGEAAISIQHAFVGANTIYSDSETQTRFRVVGIVPCVQHLEKTAGFCHSSEEDQLFELQRHGADLAVLFRRNLDEPYAGFALVYGSRVRGNLSPRQLRHAGSGIRATVLSNGGPRTLAHELGHVLGLVHDVWGSGLNTETGERTYRPRANRGAWRWSRGHAVVGDFITLMSYGHPAEGEVARPHATSLLVFSDPDLTCQGTKGDATPCGVERHLLRAADAQASVKAVSFQYASIRDGYPDGDSDGFVDPVDEMPDDPSDWLDTDKDGTGNLTDDDDDGDGVLDRRDAFPLDVSEWRDTDYDGIGDNADTDDDNDGLLDPNDLLPTDSRGPERHVAVFPAAGQDRQGFVRLHRSGNLEARVRIGAGDSVGKRLGNAVLAVKPGNTTVHFNSDDLSKGNAKKGLSGRVRGAGGDWRLELLERNHWSMELLSYIRTSDGFLTAMHDLAPKRGSDYWIATFNPASNRNQVSSLRIVNPSPDAANVRIRGIDDQGQSPGSEVSASIPAASFRTFTATELEMGDTGFDGALGDGEGKWRLLVDADTPILAISLLESPTGHLTNLSSSPPTHGVVPWMPAAGDPLGRQGFVRVINHSGEEGEVEILAYDDAGQSYGPLLLALKPQAVTHFNSEDLEWGYPAKGLSGRTGAGEGDWRLELSSELKIDVLSYIRTVDGFLTAMHNIAPVLHDGEYYVATFNPGSNRSQVSKLRLINQFEGEANVLIQGEDDGGDSPGSGVRTSLPAGAAVMIDAADLEAGFGMDGALGDGMGKWRLHVQSDQPIMVMSLLESPTGHVTNLSGVPAGNYRGRNTHYRRFVSAGPDLPEMIDIPAGSFVMGCSREGGAVYCPSSTYPQREVTIEDQFALSKHEITFQQWDACVSAGGCDGYRPDDEGWGRGNRPVINVTWDEAQTYVAWLSSETGSTIACPARRSGSMRPRQVPQPNTVGETRSVTTEPIARLVAARGTIGLRRPLGPLPPTHGASTTCTAMSRSGLRTAGTTTTRERLPTAVHGSRETALFVGPRAVAVFVMDLSKSTPFLGRDGTQANVTTSDFASRGQSRREDVQLRSHESGVLPDHDRPVMLGGAHGT